MKRIMILLAFLFVAQGALAEEKGVVDKAGETVKKGGEAAGKSLKKGGEAAGRGIEKGMKYPAKGIKKAGDWLGKKLGKAKEKKEAGD